MKKITLLSVLLLMGCLSILTLSRCDKDTNCYVNVSVIDETTKRPVSGVFIKIDIDSSFINASGRTDATGTFRATFAAPAIFNVAATYETGYDDEYPIEDFRCYRKGNNTVRLLEGDTVFTTINLEPDIIREARR